jgi:hypothetical protein
MEQLNAFSPVWHTKCAWRCAAKANLFSQSTHENGLCPVCIFMWLLSVFYCLSATIFTWVWLFSSVNSGMSLYIALERKLFATHITNKGSLLVWATMWWWRSILNRDDFPQMWHTNFFCLIHFSSGTISSVPFDPLQFCQSPLNCKCVCLSDSLNLQWRKTNIQKRFNACFYYKQTRYEMVFSRSWANYTSLINYCIHTEISLLGCNAM